MKLLTILVGGFVAWMVVLAAGLASALGGMSGPAAAGAFQPGTDIGLNPEQMKNATISLSVSDELKAPPLAVLSMVVSALGESNFLVVANRQGSGYCGVFQADPDNIPCDDTKQQATSFLQGGLGFQAGGAIYLATGQPSLSPGTIATMVEASRQPGSFYDVHRAQAEKIIAAWTSGGGFVSAPSASMGAMIAEMDRMIALHKPYTWGGGHAAFSRNGAWDCSGAVSWLMHFMGLLDGRPLTSGEFVSQGEPGRGEDFTIWANDGHVFLIMESGSHKGDAWGTATRDLDGAPGSGPMWHWHGTSGFSPVHYPGH